jgi:hypothetical protein
MVRVVSFKIIDLPQEKVFSVIRDISKLPTLFPDKYKSFKILEQSDNHIVDRRDRFNIRKRNKTESKTLLRTNQNGQK